MFGDADWQKTAEILVARNDGDKIAAASSILSDAQEALEYVGAYKDQVRQYINRAKHILNQAQDDQREFKSQISEFFNKTGVW